MGDTGHFGTRSYANAVGQRQYKLYAPSGYDGGPVPLVVMLLGCIQNADDLAIGTQMNAFAERGNSIVVYPVQKQGANQSKRWNWFKPSNQQHDKCEPSLITGITREVMTSHAVDADRVYVAGLSAERHNGGDHDSHLPRTILVASARGTTFTGIDLTAPASSAQFNRREAPSPDSAVPNLATRRPDRASCAASRDRRRPASRVEPNGSPFTRVGSFFRRVSYWQHGTESQRDIYSRP